MYQPSSFEHIGELNSEGLKHDKIKRFGSTAFKGSNRQGGENPAGTLTISAETSLPDKISQLHQYWDKTRAGSETNFLAERKQEQNHIKKEIQKRMQMIVG